MEGGGGIKTATSFFSTAKLKIPLVTVQQWSCHCNPDGRIESAKESKMQEKRMERWERRWIRTAILNLLFRY